MLGMFFSHTSIYEHFCLENVRINIDKIISVQNKNQKNTLLTHFSQYHSVVFFQFDSLFSSRFIDIKGN